VCIYTCMSPHIHVDTQTHIHTHTCICTLSLSLALALSLSRSRSRSLSTHTQHTHTYTHIHTQHVHRIHTDTHTLCTLHLVCGDVLDHVAVFERPQQLYFITDLCVCVCVCVNCLIFFKKSSKRLLHKLKKKNYEVFFTKLLL